MSAGRWAWLAAVVAAGPLSMASARAPQAAALRGPEAFAGMADRKARSVALFREMGKVLLSPRCVNCHPRGDRPLQGDAMRPHLPPVVRGAADHGAPGLECATCHGAANVSFTNGGGSIPGAPGWRLAPREMAWQGKSLDQICRQIKDRTRNGRKSPRELIDHNRNDRLVGWGWSPGEHRNPAPGTQARFGALTRAWVESGALCPRG